MLSLFGALVVAAVCWTSGKEGWAVFVLGLYFAQYVVAALV